MPMTHYSEYIVNVGITLTNVTGETSGISEYLGFGLYDKLWFNYNTGLSTIGPVRWLGV